MIVMVHGEEHAHGIGELSESTAFARHELQPPVECRAVARPHLVGNRLDQHSTGQESQSGGVQPASLAAFDAMKPLVGPRSTRLRAEFDDEVAGRSKQLLVANLHREQEIGSCGSGRAQL